MKFVKQHTAHPVQRGIRLQPSQKEAVGDDFHLGSGGSPLLTAHGEANPLSNRFLEAGGQAVCSGPSRQPAGFNHPDPPVPADLVPQGTDQGKRNPGGFSCARRSLEQQRAPWLESVAQLRQERIDRISVLPGFECQRTRLSNAISSKLLMVPRAVRSRTNGPMDIVRLAMKKTLKAEAIPS